MRYSLVALFAALPFWFPDQAQAAAAPPKLVIGYAAMSARVVPLCIAESKAFSPSTVSNPSRSSCAAAQLSLLEWPREG
ncbi:MAG TPA: hypothetical protein VH985_22415 [Candidatus Binatia bacterium]|jgi:hypothetical protein